MGAHAGYGDGSWAPGDESQPTAGSLQITSLIAEEAEKMGGEWGEGQI